MQLLDYTLGQMLEKWAYETPDHDFIVYPDRDLRFSYKQFNDRVDQLAKGLLFIGIRPGDKVGIWAKNVPVDNPDVCHGKNRSRSGDH